MKYRKFGSTDEDVSLIALGTMTWGEQNTQAEAFEQMDYAIDQGVNFFDTAELYSVPPRPETCHSTETIIGHWFAQSGKRDQVFLATKVAGPGEMVAHIRGGPALNKKHMTEALNGSLKRLQTDCIDLYQVHWPSRPTNYFGQLGYTHNEKARFTAIEETLSVLNDLVESGKVRYIGISNESPWGMLEYLRYAERNGHARIQSIQNPYNLTNRTFEVGLAEMAIREQVGLLAYSPLAFGALSGKYLNGAKPAGARITLFERFNRYQSEESQSAIAEYVSLAQQHGLSPVQMALAYVNQQAFVTSNIIGATTMEQLRENIASVDVVLSDEVVDGIQRIHKRWPNPAP